MRCDNCRSHGDLAFTLAAYPSDGADPVFVDFCSSDCLQEWTTHGGAGEWQWGVQVEPEDADEEAEAAAAD